MLTLECRGAVLCVRAGDESALALVRSHLPDEVRPVAHAPRPPDVRYDWRTVRAEAGAAGPLHVVTAREAGHHGVRPILRTRDARLAAAVLASDAEFRAAMHARGCVFVHAGAVAWQGRVILIPGQSFAGKSTLTAALLGQGAAYYSDEFAILDGSGLVHPFARRLHLRDDAGAPLASRGAEELGATTGREPLPLGLVAALAYRPGARWRVRALGPGATALALLENTVVARLHPALAIGLIARALARGATGVRGTRGEADAAARRLLALASRAHDPPRRRRRAPVAVEAS